MFSVFSQTTSHPQQVLSLLFLNLSRKWLLLTIITHDHSSLSHHLQDCQCPSVLSPSILSSIANLFTTHHILCTAQPKTLQGLSISSRTKPKVLALFHLPNCCAADIIHSHVRPLHYCAHIWNALPPVFHMTYPSLFSSHCSNFLLLERPSLTAI